MYYFNEYDYVVVYRIVCFNHFCQQFDISKYWKTRKHTATMVFTFYIQTTSVVEDIADFLLSFTGNFVVSVRRSFLFLCVPGKCCALTWVFHITILQYFRLAIPGSLMKGRRNYI